MAIDMDNPLLTVKSIMETPVLDERKWAKVPEYPTDAVLVDMEDTVAQARKLEGRAAVIKAIENPDYFGDRIVITRPNDLTTEWGHDDTVALARAGAEHVILPMVRSVEDVLEYQRIFRDNGADPLLIPGIETPGSVAHIEGIVSIDRVAGVTFGEGDLTACMGLPIYAGDGTLNPMILPSRARVFLAAAALDLAVLDIAFLKDLKDLDELRRRGEELRIMGATGLFAMYPPHVDVINDIFTPNDETIAEADAVVEAFEEAAAAGNPAVQLPDGRALLIHDYKKAKGILSRARP